eukprot:1151686-Pelagomonas_calceolata.AAC.1
MKEDMLFLGSIISRTEVTVWGRPVIPSCCLIVKGVNAESKSSHAAKEIMGEVMEHVFRETVGSAQPRPCLQEERTTGDRSSIYCCALLDRIG